MQVCTRRRLLPDAIAYCLVGAAFLLATLVHGGPARAAEAQKSIVVHTQKSPGIAASMLADSRAPNGPAAQLRAKAAKQMIRVIVGLRVTKSPSGQKRIGNHIYDPAAIAKVQAAVTGRVRGRTGPHRSHRYGFIPFMTITVGSAAFDRLLTDPDVISIQEDVSEPPLLKQSTLIIGADKLWAEGITGSGFEIAIIDSGVDKFHPMFTGKLVAQYCASSNLPNEAESLCPGGAATSTAPLAGNACPPELFGCDHGTHVAGIAAGNMGKLHGVAKGANIIAMQVFSRIDTKHFCKGDPAPCARTYPSDQVKALEQVLALSATRNIAAVNMSIGGGLFDTACDANEPARTAAIQALRAAKIAVTIASGNDGSSGGISTPACIAAAIAVGATDDRDKVAKFSNMSEDIDLMAPGVKIESAKAGGGTVELEGTSQAAPHVAGAFALLRQAKPDATVDEIEAILKCTGIPVTRNVPDSDEKIVKPRIAVDKAYEFLAGDKPPFVWDFISDLEANDWRSFAGDKFKIAAGKIKITKTGDNPIDENLVPNVTFGSEGNEILSRVKNCFSRFVVDIDFDIDMETGIPAMPAAAPSAYSALEIKNSNIRLFLHAGVDGKFGLTTGYALRLVLYNLKYSLVGEEIDGDSDHDDWRYNHYFVIQAEVVRIDTELTGISERPFRHVEQSICPPQYLSNHNVFLEGNLSGDYCASHGGQGQGQGQVTCVYPATHETPFPITPRGKNNVKFLSDGLRTVVKFNDVKLCEFTDRKYLFGSVGFGAGEGQKLLSSGAPFSYLPPVAAEKVTIRALADGEPID